MWLCHSYKNPYILIFPNKSHQGKGSLGYYIPSISQHGIASRTDQGPAPWQNQHEIVPGRYATSNCSCRNKADKKEKHKARIRRDNGLDFRKKEKQGMSDAKNTRRYPTVEIRAETFNGSTHVPVPSDSAFLKALLFELRLVDDHIFVEHRDTCTRINHSLVYSCDIEGSAPNVTLSLNLPMNGPPLQDIVVHHCVTSVDPAMLMSSSAEPLDDSVYSGPYKFPFVPPSDSFNLCYYTSQVPVPPILGSYRLIEEGSQLKITVNLKLHESIKNSFEYCEARIPFFNR
ncbi:hypothetical protein llap_18334 [Limosa lapponica baueri]|uniref:AP-5 complex subunit mu-1 n=1 Tax=Limosa lapponica baueri TaxID=1758121 RepID=A0A2I0TC73_LIMLA|nr:hypothetical protein llap_18334 [Limosa lapponica baueri]